MYYARIRYVTFNDRDLLLKMLFLLSNVVFCYLILFLIYVMHLVSIVIYASWYLIFHSLPKLIQLTLIVHFGMVCFNDTITFVFPLWNWSPIAPLFSSTISISVNHPGLLISRQRYQQNHVYKSPPGEPLDLYNHLWNQLINTVDCVGQTRKCQMYLATST